MKRLPLVVCPKCNGSGHVPLSDELLEVLSLVRKRRRITAVETRRALDPKLMFHVTAFNNRLEELRSLGLVIRTKQSREWVYLPTRSTNKIHETNHHSPT